MTRPAVAQRPAARPVVPVQEAVVGNCHIRSIQKSQLTFTGLCDLYNRLISARPETAYFGPERRFRSFEILEVDVLRLRFQIRSSLALNQNPPFMDGH